jgi:hypothetical protein
MGYYNNWLVLFSIVGLAVQAGFAAMGDAESSPSITLFLVYKILFISFLFASALITVVCYQKYIYKNVSVMLVNK